MNAETAFDLAGVGTRTSSDGDQNDQGILAGGPSGQKMAGNI